MGKVCLQRQQTMLGYVLRQTEKSYMTMLLHGWFGRSMLPCWRNHVLSTFNIRVLQEKFRECLYLAILFMASTILERS